MVEELAEVTRVELPHGLEAALGQLFILATLRLLAELQEKREEKDIYDKFLIRWLADKGLDEIEDESGAERPSEGFVGALKDIQLHSECPDWLYQFVLDIRTAGYELGYLQAGRTVDKEPDNPVEAESEAMFEDL